MGKKLGLQCNINLLSYFSVRKKISNILDILNFKYSLEPDGKKNRNKERDREESEIINNLQQVAVWRIKCSINKIKLSENWW